jgi:putative transposase
MEDVQRREIALFRYALVRQCADPDLTPRERGLLVRDLAGRDHLGWDGQRRRVARSTLDEWIRAYRTGGFDRWSRRRGPASPARQRSCWRWRCR